MSAVQIHHDLALSALMLANWEITKATETVLGRIDKTARKIITKREGTNYEPWVRQQVELLAKIVPKSS